MERILGGTSPEVRGAITRLTLARLAGNTASRCTYPFLPVIARGFDTSLGSMGVAVGIGELAGLSAPAIGRRLDRVDRRPAMLGGLLALSAGASIAVVATSVATFAVALLGITLGTITFTMSMNAWLADRVDYAERGRVIGFTETSWAAALLVGVPVLAVVVDRSSWRVAYAVVAGVLLAATVVVARRLPPDEVRTTVARAGRLELRRIAPAVGAFALLMTASALVVVVFGAWLEDAYGFSPTAVGAVSFLLGAGELAAATATIRLTDRLGKAVAVRAGAAVMVPAALALPFVGGAAALGIAVLAAFIVGFEFALVSSIPLITELQPDARASGLGLAVGCGTIGRGLAAVTTTWLYGNHGIGASALAAAACAAGVVVLVQRVHEPS